MGVISPIENQFKQHKLENFNEDNSIVVYCLPEERSWFDPIAKQLGFVRCN